jgi:dipeptidyl aminopeptidase/acylaminoacyl peptidase
MNRSLSLFLILCATGALGAQPTRPVEVPIEAFAQLPVMRDPVLSPDGTHFAYVRPVNGRGHLVIQDIGGDDQPVVVPPAGDAEFGWLHWANDSRLVFSVTASRKRGLVETLETRLWAMNKDGTDGAHIVVPSKTDKTGSSLGRDLPPAQIQDNVIHWLPDEPDHIIVSLDGDHDAEDEVRKIDIRDGRYEIVRNDTAGIQHWLADSSGRLRFGWGFRNTSLRITTKNDDGMWRSAEKAGWWDAGYFPLGFSESPNIAYMRGPDERGYDVIRTMDARSGEFLDTVFSRDGIDAGGLVDHPLTGQPAGVRYTEHFPAIHYFDETLAMLQRSIDKALPDTVNEIVSMTADQRKLLIHSYSDVDAGTFAYLNRDSGQLGFLSEAMPGLPPALMSSVEAVEYKARDGMTIPAYLTIPNGSERTNLKVVVLPHGGPGARDDRSFWFLSQFLASRGYAIFQPNFRGSTGYGKRFEHAGRKEWGGKMQDDVTDGANWIVEQGIASPDQMCIVGWSYGGYAAAMGAVKTPGLFQCAASINGVMDLPRLIADDKKYVGGSVWTRHIGLEDESAKAVSPYHLAENIQVPMLIIQAEDDVRVHEDQGRRMARRLEKLKKPVVYVPVELGGHSMTNEQARLVILSSLEKFLGNNLVGD